MRRIVAVVAIVADLFVAPPRRPAAQGVLFQPGDLLPAWTPGTLDIHQISTGRGNAAFMMFPDGTTLLLDAGDVGPNRGSPNSNDADERPNASRTPAQWVVRYIQHMMGSVDARLDYAVLTHFHGDHMGTITGAEPRSAYGDYRLRGLTEISEALPIARLIDRGWPDYSYLPPSSELTFTNYRQFVAANLAAGRLRMIRAQAGSAEAITPIREPNARMPFEVRIVAVNDRVWTGRSTDTKVRFPSLNVIPQHDDWPDENMCSIALRIRYGRFTYFSGGDMPGYPVLGAAAWHDEETDVARAVGHVDVHVVNHHGSLEEENPFWLATLRSRVMIVPAWSATHPSPDVLKRMLSRRIYPEPRDIFITLFRAPTQAATGPRAAEVTSDHGHVGVRVESGGARYWVLVLDDTSESYRITSVHGPYASG